MKKQLSKNQEISTDTNYMYIEKRKYKIMETYKNSILN